MAKIVIDFPDLMDTAEACQELGIGQATLYRWIKKGKVVITSGGGSTYIHKAEISRLKEQLKGEDGEKPDKVNDDK